VPYQTVVVATRPLIVAYLSSVWFKMTPEFIVLRCGHVLRTVLIKSETYTYMTDYCYVIGESEAHCGDG